MKTLTKRERVFCKEYTLDFNELRAAKTAGFGSERHIDYGSHLLQRVEIQAYIGELLVALHELIPLTQMEIIKEFNRIVQADRRMLFDEDGHIKPLNWIDDETAAIIEGVKITDKGGIEIKTCSKMAALTKLGETIAMFSNNVNNKMSGQLGVVAATVKTADVDPIEAAKIYRDFMDAVIIPV